MISASKGVVRADVRRWQGDAGRAVGAAATPSASTPATIHTYPPFQTPNPAFLGQRYCSSVPSPVQLLDRWGLDKLWCARARSTFFGIPHYARPNLGIWTITGDIPCTPYCATLCLFFPRFRTFFARAACIICCCICFI